MTDRRPLEISLIVLAAGAVVLVSALVVSRYRNGEPVSGNSRHGSKQTDDSEKESISAESKYPTGIVLLPASNEGSVSGTVICGNCSFQTNEPCNVILWAKETNHMLTVLQNDRYGELEKLIGST
jgi:hypothetical protein